MAAMCVLGTVRSSRRLTACDVFLVRPCNHAATFVGSCGVVMPVVVQRQVPGHGFRLSHLAVHGGFWKYFLSCVCSRCSHLKIGSLSSVSGCCMWNTDYWILGEMTWSMGGMLGSTVDKMSATVLSFGRISHIFYVAVDSNSEVSSLRSHAEWRSVLSRCFSLLSSTRCSHLETGHYFYERHGSCGDGADFLEHLCQTQLPGWCWYSGSQSPGCSGTRCAINRSDLWTYTSCFVNS